MSLLSQRREVGEFRKRYKWMALAVVVVFGVIVLRMMQLQLLEHDHYDRVARENITRTIGLPATRGIVRDTNGHVIATNRPSYDVYVTPARLAENDVETLSTLMGLDAEGRRSLEERLAAVPARRRTHQIRFFTDITREQLAAIQTHSTDLTHVEGRREITAVEVVATPVRTYPYRALGAHALGYLNELRGDELAELRPAGYRLGDRIGRTGIERAWENLLRGRRGYRRILVDADLARSERGGDEPEVIEPVPGRDLTLTLDMDLMRIVERAMRGHPSGAVAVVDVRTGAVRALLSKPSYELDAFTAGLSREEYAALRDDPFRPLIDKSIYDAFFPGSVFKPFSAIAALEDHLLDPSERVLCTGSYRYGGRNFPCNVRSGHGEVDMRQAMMQSCNVYFYALAERVGLDRVARVAQDFGLGRRTGIGINTESPGFIPTRTWYDAHDIAWRGGFALNTAIGQGDTKTTIIQVAMAYAAIANGGTLYVPQLVERISAPDGTVLEELEPRVRRRVHVSRENLAFLIDSLYGVVNDPLGTAYAVRVPNGVPIAGKTGTAQVYQRARLSEEDAARAEYRNRAHAWFAGFAPVESPEVAIVVMIEHGGSGGRYAAPVAVQILQEYLGPRYEGVSGTSGTIDAHGEAREGPPPRGPAPTGRP
jgi:penicillin-binding protein 2